MIFLQNLLGWREFGVVRCRSSVELELLAVGGMSRSWRLGSSSSRRPPPRSSSVAASELDEAVELAGCFGTPKVSSLSRPARLWCNGQCILTPISNGFGWQWLAEDRAAQGDDQVVWHALYLRKAVHAQLFQKKFRVALAASNALFE